jgi:hypothetical protein
MASLGSTIRLEATKQRKEAGFQVSIRAPFSLSIGFGHQRLECRQIALSAPYFRGPSGSITREI